MISVDSVCNATLASLFTPPTLAIGRSAPACPCNWAFCAMQASGSRQLLRDFLCVPPCVIIFVRGHLFDSAGVLSSGIMYPDQSPKAPSTTVCARSPSAASQSVSDSFWYLSSLQTIVEKVNTFFPGAPRRTHQAVLNH